MGQVTMGENFLQFTDCLKLSGRTIGLICEDDKQLVWDLSAVRACSASMDNIVAEETLQTHRMVAESYDNEFTCLKVIETYGTLVMVYHCKLMTLCSFRGHDEFRQMFYFLSLNLWRFNCYEYIY